MINYFIAFNELSHDVREPLGTWASAMGYYHNSNSAKFRAKELERIGYKNVTVFKYDGCNPYDKIMTHCVSWDLVMKNKID